MGHRCADRRGVGKDHNPERLRVFYGVGGRALRPELPDRLPGPEWAEAVAVYHQVWGQIDAAALRRAELGAWVSNRAVRAGS